MFTKGHWQEAKSFAKQLFQWPARTRHIGRNVFGVTMPYTASVENWYGVLIKEPFPQWLRPYDRNDHRFEITNDRYEISIPMTVQDAKAAKPYLAMEIIGTLANSEVHREEINTTATIDSPYEDSISLDYAEFSWTGLRVVDVRSQNVLFSLKQ